MNDSQKEFDTALEKISEEFKEEHEKQVSDAVKAIILIRLFLIDLLNDYQKGGVIRRGRLNALLRDLDFYEREFRKQAEQSFHTLIENTSKWTTAKLTGAGLDVKSVDSLNKRIIQSAIKRPGEDGLILSDRVWNLSGDMRDRLSSVIRPAVLKGESITMISQKIKEVHDNEEWKIERVAISESTNTHRSATIQNGLESEIVVGYEIVDNGHRHRNHSSHKCYKLARRDTYGLGPGKYPKNIPEGLMNQLISPHPQCSSRLKYLISEEV
ncbi:hypothetical protein V7183_10940 [Bacillus sp. JJ1127]|uniref:hypothetical protein n=1 Tax=Bacillus sp. JJ1127 TaxID=3122952 RepID=UPI002FFDBC70